MASSSFFNRTYELNIRGDGIDISVDRLDVRFDVQFYTGPRTGSASITIIGLSYDTISILEPFTVASPGTLMTGKGIRVTLKAGYDDSNETIFDGLLYSVSISEPPELAVSISARGFRSISDLERKNIVTEPDIKVTELASSAFAVFGLQFNNQSHINNMKKMGSKVLDGDLVDFMRAIQRMSKWHLTYLPADEVIVATDYIPREAYETINKTSGLLGVPSVNVYSATICTWLRADTPAVSRMVTLESQLHPSANGNYWINSIRYKGEYRGKSWYTMYNGIRLRS